MDVVICLRSALFFMSASPASLRFPAVVSLKIGAQVLHVTPKVPSKLNHRIPFRA
jgi:hypothetical protein